MSLVKYSKIWIGLLALAGVLVFSNCGKKSDSGMKETTDMAMTEKSMKVDTKVLGSCKPCHFLDKDQSHSMKGFGPGLMGIYEKKPVSEGIPFEKWDEASLDKWLANPKEIKSGTKMTIKVASPEKRKEIIEALKNL